MSLFQNFEKHFAVVGVTELFNQSIQVLEDHLPKYFKGVKKVISDEPDLLQTNKNGFKPEVSHSTKSALAAAMTREIDFYVMYLCPSQLTFLTFFNIKVICSIFEEDIYELYGFRFTMAF